MTLFSAPSGAERNEIPSYDDQRVIVVSGEF